MKVEAYEARCAAAQRRSGDAIIKTDTDCVSVAADYIPTIEDTFALPPRLRQVNPALGILIAKFGSARIRFPGSNNCGSLTLDP